ncbi:MAG: hypothetical protein Q7S16_04975, partial [bacterium]|nr:hypothetical protein [bacterium]
RDFDLICSVKESLKLRNKIYRRKPRFRKDGYSRGGMAMIMVRDFGQIKNIIVPLFYKKLAGYKNKQFLDWLETIGSDPIVPQHFKFIYKIYKDGFYDKPEIIKKYQ